MKEITKKNIIKNRFKNSLATYNEAAIIQKSISEKISKLVIEHAKESKNLLEIGCGTGFLSISLAQNLKNIQKYYLNDLVKECFKENKLQDLTHKNTYIQPIVGDAEQVEFPQNLDLIVSSSTVQWFKDLPSFLKKTNRSLKEDGLLIFSSFTKNNFYEISSISGIGLDYLSLSSVNEQLKNTGFEILEQEEELKITYFKTALEVLKHIRATGVNGISSKVWTKEQMLNFSSTYEALYKNKKGLHLTYNPYYIVARKIRNA